MTRAELHRMAMDAWSAWTAVFVVLVLLEAAERGFVSRFFNLTWIVLVILAATVAVMATHPGSGATIHRPPRGVEALLQFACVAGAAAAWILLPKDLALHWRALASGVILMAALTALPALSKEE